MGAMKTWLIFILVVEGFCAPPEPTGTSTKQVTDNEASSAEFSVPTNMNMADYYYSIFGKHLDYDYMEPILTFDEPVQNELSDEKLSETNKGSSPWDSHSRRKRFILSPNFLNSTRQWTQRIRKMHMERMRLRNERRRQWQENRIKYLNSRSAALQRQSALMAQMQQRQQITRNVPAGQLQKNSSVIVFSLTSTAKPTTVSNSAINLGTNTIPVRQVPIPLKQ